MDKYREQLHARILDIPASYCPEPFQDFTVRGENQRVITWNQKMVTDSGVVTQRLIDLVTMLENRAELTKLII